MKREKSQSARVVWIVSVRWKGKDLLNTSEFRTGYVDCKQVVLSTQIQNKRFAFRTGYVDCKSKGFSLTMQSRMQKSENDGAKEQQLYAQRKILLPTGEGIFSL